VGFRRLPSHFFFLLLVLGAVSRPRCVSSTFSQLPTAAGEIAPGAGISGGEWEGRFTFRLDLLSGFGCGGWASARGRGRGIFVLGMRASFCS
jgi:hypothetical protein